MSNSKAGKAGVYLIVIDGASADAFELPEPYTWQDLKDFVRPEAEHEFWADLQSVPNGTGQKRGCIRTQRSKEAENLYREYALDPSQNTSNTNAAGFLTRASPDGRRLRIVLWDISQSPPKQIAPNPAQTMSETQAKWASEVTTNPPGWQSVAATQSGPQQQSARYQSQASLVEAMEGLSIQQRQQLQAAYYAQQQQQQRAQAQAQAQAQMQAQVEAQARAQAARQAEQAQQAQAAYYAAQMRLARHDSVHPESSSSRTTAQYVSSQTGTPVNIGGGVVKTVCRGVFVSGLNHKAREEDVKHKFSSVGDVVKCVLHKDASSGKSKGVATLLFKSVSEAQKAVDKYNKTTWMDRQIKVRHDKEETTVSAPPRLDCSPLIVNGSRVH